VTFDAIVLAGDRSSRLGGHDKALVTVGGRTLLEAAVSAVAAAKTVVVVGPRRDLPLPVTWVQESPPRSGPVAAVAAGSGAVSSELVVLLAVDHPLITSGDVSRLIRSTAGDGAVAVDAGGHVQPLIAVYRRAALAAALARLPATGGAKVRDLIAGLQVARLAVGASARDCDTWEDLDEVRKLTEFRR
jgi:molybdopterin-guanine dinucleotide biosynthesis protein A